MVIERFKEPRGDPGVPALPGKGRMMPEGLDYAESWVAINFDRCFQLVECEDARFWSSGPPTGRIWWNLSLSRHAVPRRRRNS